MINFIDYLPQEHQTQDWKRHKKLCSYLSTAAEEVGADNFFGQEFQLEEGEDEELVLEEDYQEEELGVEEETKEKIRLAKENQEKGLELKEEMKEEIPLEESEVAKEEICLEESEVANAKDEVDVEEVELELKNLSLKKETTEDLEKVNQVGWIVINRS